MANDKPKTTRKSIKVVYRQMRASMPASSPKRSSTCPLSFKIVQEAQKCLSQNGARASRSVIVRRSSSLSKLQPV
eukprot:2191105-Pleurochrysis_carterae.AAC.3